MPRLCGLDLVARMRAAGMTLPIIINSGCLGLGEASSHPRLDLSAVLHKPFEFTDVLDAVKRSLPLPQNRGQEIIRDGQAAPSNVVPLQFVKTVPVPAQSAGITTRFI